MKKTIGQDFNFGFAGTPSRSVDEIITAFPYKGEEPLLFGLVATLDASKEGVKAFAQGDKGEDVIGFTVVNARANHTYNQQDFSYTKYDVADVLVRGSMTVEVMGGVPTIKGKVYALPGGKVTADSTAEGAVALTNVVFSKAGKDINNMAEITIVQRTV